MDYGLNSGNLEPFESPKPELVVIEPARGKDDQTLITRTAAYVRVSSDSVDQLNSFSAQVTYYTSLIREKANWKLVDIYADEGLTGLNAEKRSEYQRMLKDCRKGRIDQILVKSISRFSRNTKECLEAIRELKSLGVSVIFEKENINTSQMPNEFLLSILSYGAQEESLSISGNLKWSYRHRMEKGEFLTCKAPTGYRLQNNMLYISEEHAELVRYIFSSYLNGKSKSVIAGELTARGIPTRDGKSVWRRSAIDYILKNERYTGDALLQKKYTADTLPLRQKLNKGEKAQYLICRSHDPIISRADFEKVQELNKKQKITGSMPKEYSLSRKLYCGECGTVFRRKQGRGKIYWVCRTHDASGNEACSMKQISETDVYRAFINLYHKLKHNREKILTPMLEQLQELKRGRNLNDKQVIEINKQIAELTERNHVLSGLKAKGYIDSAFYISQTDEADQALAQLRRKKAQLLEREGDEAMLRNTQMLLELLECSPDRIEDFDGELFEGLIEKITLDVGGNVRFQLRNGLELRKQIEGREG